MDEMAIHACKMNSKNYDLMKLILKVISITDEKNKNKYRYSIPGRPSVISWDKVYTTVKLTNELYALFNELID